MNNDKQKMISNKKKHKGIYFGIGLGLTAIVGTTIPVIVKAFNTSDQVPENKVLFDAGENHTFDSKQKTMLVDCKKSTSLADIAGNLKVYNKSTTSTVNDFVGWAYSKDFKNGKVATDKLIHGDTKVSPKSAITAVYKSTISNDEGISWKTISFERGSAASKAIITGNTKFNIISGTCLREVNTPICEPKVAGTEKFIGWHKKGQTDEFARNVPITEDTVFEPIISAAAKITFIAPTGAQIIGSDTISVVENTKFKDINTPVVSCMQQNMVFGGWYEDQSYTKMFDPQKTISGSDIKAYANIVDVNSETVTVVSTQDPETPTGITYEGNTKFAIPRNAIWASYNRPIPKAENSKLAYWMYQIPGSSDWKLPSEETKFGNVSTAIIKPVFESSISAVVFSTQFDTLTKTEKTKITAQVLPSTSAQTVTWGIYTDEGCGTKVPATDGSIDAEGNVIINNSYTNEAVYVKATSTIDTNKFAVKKFTFADPYESTDDFWTFDATNGWCKLNNLATPDSAKQIQYVKADGTVVKTEARTAFNSKIYVGKKATFVPSYFLANCTAFDNDIVFPAQTEHAFRIGDYFMLGCSAFNTKLTLTDVTSVGDYFMNGCSAYRQSTELNVKSVGKSFFKDLVDYNATITLGDRITSIGEEFLENCIKFDRNITLPASLTNVGSHFMYKCNNFSTKEGATDTTGDIKVECAATAFDPNMENLAAESESENIYAKGFTVSGDKADDFPYKTLYDTAAGRYRKNNSEGKVVDRIIIKEGSTQKTEFTVGETFDSTGLTIQVYYVGETEVGKEITEGFTCTKDDGTDLADYVFKDADKPGINVNITYQSKTTSYGVTVKDAGEVETLPDYLTYINAPGTDNIYIRAKNSQAWPETVTTLNIAKQYKIEDENGNEKIKNVTGLYATRIEDEQGLTILITGAFEGCKPLESITLPDTIQFIDEKSFWKIQGMKGKTITIPSSVTYIGAEIVEENEALINFADTTSQWTFSNTTEWTPSDDASANTATILENEGYYLCKDNTPVPDYLSLYEQDGKYYISGKNDETYPSILVIHPKYVSDDGQTVKVEGVRANAFNDQDNIGTILLPNTITEIQAQAFAGLPSLLEIKIPASVTTLGPNLFDNTESKISGLKRLFFEDLTKTWVADDESSTQYKPTSDAASNKNVYDETVKNYTLTCNVGPVKKTTLPDYYAYEVVRVGDTDMINIKANPDKAPSNKVEILPKYIIDGIEYPVHGLMTEAFKDNKNITEVTIGQGVTDLSLSAFENCTSLASVSLPEGITLINPSCFNGCSALTEITLPSTLTAIGSYAFYNTGITSLTIPSAVSGIDQCGIYTGEDEDGKPKLTSLTFEDLYTKWEWDSGQQSWQPTDDPAANATTYNTTLKDTAINKKHQDVLLVYDEAQDAYVLDGGATSMEFEPGKIYTFNFEISDGHPIFDFALLGTTETEEPAEIRMIKYMCSCDELYEGKQKIASWVCTDGCHITPPGGAVTPQKAYCIYSGNVQISCQIKGTAKLTKIPKVLELVS